MNPAHPTAKFLRTHRRRARGTLLAWSGAVTLASAVFMGAVHLGWTTRGIEWVLLPIFIAAFLLGAWFRRAPRLTPHQLAHELDTRWALHARLETAVELGGSDSAWAATQRDDATQQLAGKKPPGALAWFAGLLAVAVMLCLVSVEGTALVVRAIHVTPPRPVSAAGAAVPATPPPPPEFHAAIEWKTPDSEIKATTIEEVPLVALADSTTGFGSPSLEIVVNGDREVSRPLDAPAIASAATPGTHELAASLYLDELDVKEGDIVSYRLVAELNTADKKKVTSVPQFVEIRRAQRDTELHAGKVSPLAVLLLELKAAQLDLIKQNFSLAQTAGASADPGWTAENSRVAAAQEALSGRIDELLKLFQTAHAPGAASDLAKEAQTLMHKAAEEIAAGTNEPAEKTQARALAIITDLSKNIRKALSGPAAPVDDPFKDDQTFKSVPRAETPAGELEELATRQQKNNARAGGNAEAAKAEQAAIARDAQKLIASGKIDPQAGPALGTGASAAGEAAQQLALGDTDAARVPSAAALQAFEEAVAEQEKAGRAMAAAGLDQIRRTLNTASRASASARAEQIAQVRTALRAAAAEQQQTGSADAARGLAQLAELAGSKAASASAPNSPERAREIAVAAAGLQVELMPRTVALSRAVRLLNRAGQPGSGSDAGTGGSPLSDVEIAAQEAQWLSGETTTIELAREVSAQADTLQKSGGGGAPPRAAMENAVKLAAVLENARSRPGELVRRFNPADVDPAYRTAVETYFERLSRDARSAPRAPAK